GPGARRSIPASDIVDRLDAVQAALDPSTEPLAAARAAAGALEALDRLLRSTDGVAALVRDPSVGTRIEATGTVVGAWLAATESSLDDLNRTDGSLEELNAALIRLKDAAWAVSRDRVPTAAG